MLTALTALATLAVAALADRSRSDRDLRRWGRFSKVRDDEGRLLVVHHGSGIDIQDFSYEFTGIGHDQHGSGFYFTTDVGEAAGYTEKRKEADIEKPGGESSPTIVHAYLDIRSPLDSEDVGDISLRQVYQFMRLAPSNDWLEDWGDVDFEGRDRVMAKAAQAYTIEDYNLVRALFSIATDMYGDDVEGFNRAVAEILGYDGVVHRLRGGGAHYIAFFPEQIRVAGKTNKDS